MGRTSSTLRRALVTSVLALTVSVAVAPAAHASAAIVAGIQGSGGPSATGIQGSGGPSADGIQGTG
jgi:hypothetical protein